MQNLWRRGRLLGVAGVVVVLAAVSSCSTTTSPHTRRSTASVGTATSPSAPRTATSTSASPKAAAAPAIAQCRTSDLSVSMHVLGVAAGSAYYAITLVNHSSRACRSGGYGGVSMVGDGNGTQLGAPARRDTSATPAPFTLQPGGRARARLQLGQALNYSPEKCDPAPADGFRIYPPNQTRSAYVAGPATACRSATVSLMSLRPYRRVG